MPSARHAVVLLGPLGHRQSGYGLEALPENLQDSAPALQAICELDLTELQAIVPPRGFGRD